ncbi:HalOD1 output domain-containing protein [Halorussus salinisoli]|uniref:HalOD1 output domain-containing protein n=1 Tax=Halorussus salinisoli TaxID=2558242 RepID=UPI0014853162|nr:HalOD1 output domain-containing protein [Halorussus salinisoli]
MSQSVSGDTFEKRSTSQRVITAVAEETGNDPTEVGPLYHVVDPDALDRLFSATKGSGRNQGYVAFTFGGCDVVVSGNGDVDVTERDVATELADEDGDIRSLGTNLDETA